VRRYRPLSFLVAAGLAGAWLVAGLQAASGLAAAVTEQPRNVLVLYSNSRLLPANVEFEQGFRSMFPPDADRSVMVFDEFLDMPRFAGPAYGHTVETYLRDKYASRPPDVTVAVGEQALQFLVGHRGALFPRVPVIFELVERSLLPSISPLPPGVRGIPLDVDFADTIDRALRWHPRARRLVIVTGTDAPDRRWEAELRATVPRFKDRAAAEFLAGLPTRDVLRRLGELTSDSVVVTTGYFKDGAGRACIPHQIVEAMAAVSGAPVYAPFDPLLGTGIVGGFMFSVEAQGRVAGTAVNELLDGTALDALHLPDAMPQTLNVDWRQVLRWGIDANAIPADAVLYFKTPSFFEAHRRQAIAAIAVIVLQAGMIAALLVERRRRRSAELAVQKQRSELAHASRLAVAGELTASIAHEINQPLGAILSNADAADLILELGANRRDELRAILADIRRDDLRASEVIRRLRATLAKHQVERIPFELNDAVREAGATLRAEARRRQVTLDFRPATKAITMVGDRIQVEQVVANLLLNAMDAVADAPEDRRTIVVSVEDSDGTVEIAVRDRGHGIPPGDMPKLFESFFSTKRQGMGLGLSIARTLVEAQGGRIRAESDPGEGAVFRVELPLAGTDVPPPPQA
jgi:signal transduction histidine kinase